MTGYSIFSIKDMLDELGESNVKEKLSSFSCPINKDIEYFIKWKAIEFARQNIAPTFLVYASYKEEWVLCGYYTIAIKDFTVAKSDVSSKTFGRLKKFGTYDTTMQRCNIPAPLIAQLGKNYTNGYNKIIRGDELLELALADVRKAQSILGGKVVYLESEDKDKLRTFYEENGFRVFGKRNLDKDERDKLDGEYLLQWLKYLE